MTIQQKAMVLSWVLMGVFAICILVLPLMLVHK